MAADDPKSPPARPVLSYASESGQPKPSIWGPISVLFLASVLSPISLLGIIGGLVILCNAMDEKPTAIVLVCVALILAWSGSLAYWIVLKTYVAVMELRRIPSEDWRWARAARTRGRF